MGGVSSGEARPCDGHVHFEGELSLDNNGGFASWRIGAQLPDLSHQHGLRLRVRGDGQIYKLSLRTDGAWDGVSWQVPFATVEGEWTTVDLLFEDLSPTWRGRLVTRAAPFDASRITQVGLQISDKQEGHFAFEVESISAWRDSDRDRPGSLGAARARSSHLARLVDEEADGSVLRLALLRSERLLVIAAPSSLDADASIQAGRAFAHAAALAERELRVVQLMGAGGGRLAGRTLGEAQVRDLRERWDLPADEWCLALVGKDGGVKARWYEPIDPAVALETVDGMPMRRREMERGDPH